MVSYKAEDHQLLCVGKDYASHMAGRKSLLELAADVDARSPDAQVLKIPIESNFINNSVAAAADLFTALDGMALPGVVACQSGRRARIVVAAWVAARKGGSADEAVAYLESTGDCKDASVAHWVRGAVCSHTTARTNPLVFRQLFEKESSTYTYLLADAVTREAVLIDPVDLTVDRDLAVADRVVTADGVSGLRLTKGLNTHCHADHITGTAGLKAKVPGFKSHIAQASGAKADVYLKDGNHISIGGRYVEVIATPGHTDGCVSFVTDDRSMVFTGDALLITGCGRTDFQQGNSHTLYKSIKERIFTLPADCAVYPGHDYHGRMRSSVREERVNNQRLGEGKTEDQFVDIMANLNLPYPKKIDASLPANLLDGFPDEAALKAANAA